MGGRRCGDLADQVGGGGRAARAAHRCQVRSGQPPTAHGTATRWQTNITATNRHCHHSTAHRFQWASQCSLGWSAALPLLRSHQSAATPQVFNVPAAAFAAQTGVDGPGSSSGLAELAGPWVQLLTSSEGFARACAATTPAVLRCLTVEDLDAKLAIDLLRVLQLIHRHNRSPRQFAAEHELLPLIEAVCVRMARRPMVAKMASETLRQIETIS